MAKIEAGKLEAKIAELLAAFYERRRARLAELKLVKILKRKNPYLYRARGVSSASAIVREILEAFITSSDEGIFGNVFFEPLAKWAAEQAASGTPGVNVSVAASEGVDVSVEDAVCYAAIAVKSGVNIFNAQSRKRQLQDFDALRRRVSKLNKRFDAVIGYCYGQKKRREDSTSPVIELAGQEFWERVTGEEGFYIRFLSLMRDLPQKHAPIFREELGRAENRLVAEFLFHFADASGQIDWPKLAAFNSGKETLKLAKYSGQPTS